MEAKVTRDNTLAKENAKMYKKATKESEEKFNYSDGKEKTRKVKTYSNGVVKSSLSMVTKKGKKIV